MARRVCRAATTVPAPTGPDAADFTIRTPDVSGELRAKRAGNGGDRTYDLAFTGRDAAGNTASCVAEIVSLHDQGNR